MSSIYMDVLKDRMYCDAANSLSRRSAQTAMYNILDCLIRILGPILVHTAEEAWDSMEFKSQDVDTVHLADMPKVDDSIDFQSAEPKWQKLMGLRDEVLRVLEGLRQEKKIASNQQACVTVCCDDRDMAILKEFGLEQFAALCIVSEVKIIKATGETTIAAEKSGFGKCQRCWNYWPSVGTNDKLPDLCERCITVVSSA
jgi:isoleucyl-tRNA synthetase